MNGVIEDNGGRSGVLAALAITAGGMMLIWPAFANGYPLLFSDTGAFLAQLLVPFMIWDKPWVYGPVLAIVSLKLTLWLPALAQGLLLSWLLWRVQAMLRPASPGWHLIICLTLALGSAAPWFAALLMPDILAPVTVLCLFLLVQGDSERRRWLLVLLATFAIAAHLTHLVIAAACIAVLLLIRPRRVMSAAAPLLAACAVLMVTNVVGHGRFGISPYGSVFALARLVADGPAKTYLEETCPDSGAWLCSWLGRLPDNADAFLWDPAGPAVSIPGHWPALAPEASRIVTGTILRHPLAVARAAAANTAEQLVLLRLDEVLGASWLDETVGLRLRDHYPRAEEARFQHAAQRHDRLRAIAAPWQAPHMLLLDIGAAGTLAILVRSLLARAWRDHDALFSFTVLSLAAVLANAFATGALSGPHDRYQARIAWLLLLPPLLYGARLHGTRRATSAGVDRTRAS